MKNIIFSFAVKIKLEGRGLRCLLIIPSEANPGPMNMKQNLNVTFYILIQYLNEIDFAIKSAACLSKLTITNKSTLETEGRKGVCVDGGSPPCECPIQAIWRASKAK